ncbi:MAG: quercetin 2,3-dioxygenase [Bryobacteraceae bacterium]
MLAEAIAPFTRRRSLENTYAYGGGTVSILANGQETGGAFSLIETVQIPGSEPPLHVHEREDEFFYVLKGEVNVLVGGKAHKLGPGDTMFLPRGIPHTFRIKSPVAHLLGVITPSGFERWFQTIGTRARSFDLPELSGPPSSEMLETMRALSAELGVRILDTPVDI